MTTPSSAPQPAPQPAPHPAPHAAPSLPTPSRVAAIAPPRRRLWWFAAVLAAVVLVGGATVAVRAWLATGGPDGAVRGYFAALRDGDAATALGYGTVPDGSREYLTDDVLAEQQRIARIDDVEVTRVADDGDRARVSVRYALDFAAGSQRQSAVVPVHRQDDGWRLDRAAVATQLLVEQADERARLAGTEVPQGTTLLFPGAAPLTFDTPYLGLDPAHGVIGPDAETTTQLEVRVTAAGRDAVLAALRTKLGTCLRSGGDPRCPLPGERYIPGSVRGAVSGSLSSRITIDISTSAAGEFEISGDVPVRGRYRRLEFDNRVTSRADADFSVRVAAHTYAVSPLTLRWDAPT